LKLTINTATNIATTVSACNSYLWSKNSVTYTQSGNYTYSYTNGNGCASVDTLHLTIAPRPVAGVLSGTANVCIGAVSSYSSSGNAGGVWKSTNESVATINSVSGLLTSLSVGVTTIRYIVSSSYCGSDTASIEIHINNCNTVVNVKAFIQGFYEGDNLMRAGLLNSEIAGATSLQADSITIEIRSAVSGNLVENPVMTILNTDGTATAVFPHLEGTKYIVLKHRNSIEIWSADPVSMSSVVNYDFSNAATKAYGDNMVDVGGGVFAMWSGDLNQDGAIESADYTMIENDILSILFGYYVSDLTGDGVVESADYTLMENNVLNIIFAAKPF
jgi:hypothetical protein